VTPSRMPHVSRRFDAMLVWMHQTPLEIDRPYLLKHTTQQITANVTAVLHKINVNTQAKEPADGLDLNEIGAVSLETHKPLFFDAYRKTRATGSFILIDPVTNLTLGAGMITERAPSEDRTRRTALQGVEFERSRLTAAERWERNGHRPATIWLTARLELAYLLERELFDRGCHVHVLSDDFDSHMLPELAKLSCSAGLITICSVAYTDSRELERARTVIGDEMFIHVDPESLSSRDEDAALQVSALLERAGIILPDERGVSGDGI